MVNAVEEITICNIRTDKDSRRNIYVPTRISGVTVYHSAGTNASPRQSTTGRSDNTSYKVRIPLNAEVEDGRKYIRSMEYEKLSDEEAKQYWTIQSNSFVVLGHVEDESALTDTPSVAHCGNDYFEVVDYADNTRRGSDSVKHWRLGGS